MDFELRSKHYIYIRKQKQLQLDQCSSANKNITIIPLYYSNHKMPPTVTREGQEEYNETSFLITNLFRITYYMNTNLFTFDMTSLISGSFFLAKSKPMNIYSRCKSGRIKFIRVFQYGHGNLKCTFYT